MANCPQSIVLTETSFLLGRSIHCAVNREGIKGRLFSFAGKNLPLIDLLNIYNVRYLHGNLGSTWALFRTTAK